MCEPGKFLQRGVTGLLQRDKAAQAFPALAVLPIIVKVIYGGEVQEMMWPTGC